MFLFLSPSSRGTARAEIIPLLTFRIVVVSPSSGYSFTLYMPSTTTFRGYLKSKAWFFFVCFFKHSEIIDRQNKWSDLTLPLHVSSKDVRRGCRTEHGVAVHVHVHHLSQLTVCGADDEATCLRYFNFNLHGTILALAVSLLIRQQLKAIAFVPCRRPWVHS